MEKKKIIGFYDYTVVLTYLGMGFAFLGIVNSINTNYTASMICLMLAGLCDMFDGAVASTKERSTYQKQFGIQIDSLCDLISFGVLPGIFVYEIYEGQFVGKLSACFYILCGLIRLAYFNVQELDRQQQTTSVREVYLGVPITSAALVMPLVYVLYSAFDVINSGIFVIIAVLLAMGFVIGVEVRKPHNMGKVVMVLVGVLELVELIRLR